MVLNTEWSLSIIENTDDADLMTKFIEDQDCKCGPTGVDCLPLPCISFYILKVTTAHLPGVEPIVPAVKFSLLVESTFSWTSWTADLKLELVHAMGHPGFPRQRGRQPQRRVICPVARGVCVWIPYSMRHTKCLAVIAGCNWWCSNNVNNDMLAYDGWTFIGGTSSCVSLHKCVIQ